MELVHASADQMTKYAVHIDLHPLEHCVKIVRWALKECYRSFSAQDDEEPHFEDADRAGPALRVLLALFREKDEFADQEAAVEFLSSLESAEDARVTSKILVWTHDIHHKILAKVSKAPMAASTTVELADMVEPYIQTAESPYIDLNDNDVIECCVWPFVKLAR